MMGLRRRDAGGAMKSTYARSEPFLAGETVTGGRFACLRCQREIDKRPGSVTNLPVCPHCQNDTWRAA
jgi:hypothetical protein